MSEFDTGYSVTIGKPVVHADKKAAGESVSFPCEAIPDGSYLVSLEVNGSVEAYRESMEFSSGSCTVGAYTLSYSSYALTVSGTSNNDIVRVMVEPLYVKTTDAFRAAVKKDAPATPNELPAVTASDAGKVLAVQSVTTKGAVIVPEQSARLTSTPTTLSDTNASLFTDGADVIVSAGQYEYEAKVEDGVVYISAQGITIERSGDTLEASYSGGTYNVVISVNLADNSGVWGAEHLYGYGRRIQVEATYSNGEYSTDTQITPNELMNAITAGYDFQLFVGAAISRMHLVALDGDTYAMFRATLMNGATVEVLFNGFDQEYLTISIYPYDTRFIVTLTPTAQDFSGTMDKTVAEINAAYEAGQEIWFKVMTGATTYTMCPIAQVGTDDFDYPSFKAYIIDNNNNVLIYAFTGTTNDGTEQTYHTSIYTITHAT